MQYRCFSCRSSSTRERVCNAGHGKTIEYRPFHRIMANEMSTYPCILVIRMSRAIALCSPIYQVIIDSCSWSTLVTMDAVFSSSYPSSFCLRLVNQLGIDQMAERRWAMNIDEQRRPIWEYDDSRELSITPSDVQTLVDRLRVNRSIVTFNAHRLRSVCFELLELYETFRSTMMNHSENHVSEQSSTETSDQMATMLEFFLQMDCTLSLWCSRSKISPSLVLLLLLRCSRCLLHENMCLSWCTTDH